MFTLLEQIAGSFEISMSDAKTLLFHLHPNPTATVTTSESNLGPVHLQLSSFLQSLALEINKTIQYASRSYRFATPDQLLLMGAGTRIPYLDQSISMRISLPAKPWTIDLSENLFGNQHSATYTIAAGITALAWEAESCTSICYLPPLSGDG